MPPRQPRNYEDILTDALVDDILSDGDHIAAEQGGPAGTRRPSEREMIELWGQTDPAVEYAQLVVRLLTGGVPPEEAQQFKLVQMYPETLELFAQPPDAATADALARLAEYPYRHGTYAHLDPDERVTFANRMHAEWEKRQVDAEAPVAQHVWKPDGNEGMRNTFMSPEQDVTPVGG